MLNSEYSLGKSTRKRKPVGGAVPLSDVEKNIKVHMGHLISLDTFTEKLPTWLDKADVRKVSSSRRQADIHLSEFLSGCNPMAPGVIRVGPSSFCERDRLAAYLRRTRACKGQKSPSDFFSFPFSLFRYSLIVKCIFTVAFYGRKSKHHLITVSIKVS